MFQLWNVALLCTITGKTELTVIQQTDDWTLHKASKLRKVTAKEPHCSESCKQACKWRVERKKKKSPYKKRGQQKPVLIQGAVSAGASPLSTIKSKVNIASFPLVRLPSCHPVIKMHLHILYMIIWKIICLTVHSFKQRILFQPEVEQHIHVSTCGHFETSLGNAGHHSCMHSHLPQRHETGSLALLCRFL